MLQRVYGDNTVMHTSFWVAQEVQCELQGDERWLQKREAFNKQDGGQVGKADGVCQSLVHSGHKKDSVWKIITKIWACLKSNGIGCAEDPAVPNWKKHYWNYPSFHEGYNNVAKGHPRRILPTVHRSVAEKDGKVL